MLYNGLQVAKVYTNNIHISMLDNILQLPLICSIIFSSCILKHKIIIVGAPRCYNKRHNVNTFGFFKSLMLTKKHHIGN